MLNNPWGTVRFTDKVALITGGASGIGRATANRLAAEGAHVIIADNNVPLANQAVSQIEADGGKASHIEVDLAGDEAVAACGWAVAERFPALHMLVNNAAILRHGRIEDGSWQGNWDAETAVGLRGWVLHDPSAAADAEKRGRRDCQYLIGSRFSRQARYVGLRCHKSRPGVRHEDHGAGVCRRRDSRQRRCAGLDCHGDALWGGRPTPRRERRSWRRHQPRAAS